MKSEDGDVLDTQSILDLGRARSEVDPDDSEEESHPSVHSESDAEREDIPRVVLEIPTDENTRLVDRGPEGRVCRRGDNVPLRRLRLLGSVLGGLLAPRLGESIEVFFGRERRSCRVVELGVDDGDGVVGGVRMLRHGETKFLEVLVKVLYRGC